MAIGQMYRWTGGQVDTQPLYLRDVSPDCPTVPLHISHPGRDRDLTVTSQSDFPRVGLISGIL